MNAGETDTLTGSLFKLKSLCLKKLKVVKCRYTSDKYLSIDVHIHKTHLSQSALCWGEVSDKSCFSYCK